MSDLSSLMSVAPITAAGMIGSNNAQNQQSEALRQQELQQIIAQKIQQMKQNEQMNPLLVEHQGLQNRGLQEGLAGITADSRLKTQNADIGAATMQSDINAKNFGNEEKIIEGKMKRLDAMGKQFLTMGPMLAQVPDEPGRRHAYFTQQLKSMGMREDDPAAQQYLGFLEKIPSAKLPDVLNTMGKQMIDQSAAYRQHIDGINATNAMHIKTTGMTNATTLKAEQMRIDAGKYQKKQEATDFQSQVDVALRKAAGSPKGQYAILLRAAAVATQMGNGDLATKYGEQAAQLENLVQADAGRGANAAPGGVNIGQMGNIPVNPPLPVRPNAPVTPPGGAAPAAAPQLTPAGQGQVARVRVVSADGKVGTIPAAQLQQALQQGFKRAP